MVRLLKHLLILTTLISMAGAGLAQVAQTTFGPVSEIVICGDGGAQVLRLDVQGKPVKEKACCDCLDCLVQSAVPALATHPTLSQPTAFVTALFAMPESRAASPLRYTRPMPRAPPTLARQNNLNSAILDIDQSLRGQAVQNSGQKPEAAR